MKRDLVKILLIEDNPEDAYLLERNLSVRNPNEFLVHYASCLQEALDHFRKTVFDVVILDLDLPDSRGLETFNRLNGLGLEVPMIVLTGYDDEKTALEAVRRGAEDYLVKGAFDNAFLLRTLRYGIERHRIKKELSAVTKELRTVNKRLEELTLVDPLTEVLNRRGLQQILSRELDYVKREESSLLFLIVNLDNFKEINQSLGHVAGDIVLKEISRRLLRALRVSDYVSRVGGDEFLILLPQTRFAEGVRVAEKIRLAVARNSVSVNSGRAVHITASLGLGMVNADMGSLDQLLSRSHLLLYQSKAGGKNRVAYEGSDGPEYAHDSKEFVSVQAALRDARQFQALRQPIISLADNRLIGYEFLSRCTVAGFEMPDDFFRFSMESNMLTTVDHHCFRACVRAGRSLPPETKRHLNLFPSTMMATPAAYLLETMKADGFPEGFCIEISEQQIIGEPSYLVDAVSTLRKEGISIAIDDVGFGRSCLESLVVLEPDVVKIDKKWVIGIKKDANRRRSLNRLLKVSQALGCDVVAEGIESVEELEVLREMGVAYGQGYFFGKPAPNWEEPELPASLPRAAI